MEMDSEESVEDERRRRRKDTGANSRNNTKLTAEQLGKKRAADRAAQRALRQRTRQHVERLENRYRELSENTTVTLAFEAAERRRLELEEELRHLRAAQEELNARIEIAALPSPSGSSGSSESTSTPQERRAIAPSHGIASNQPTGAHAALRELSSATRLGHVSSASTVRSMRLQDTRKETSTHYITQVSQLPKSDDITKPLASILPGCVSKLGHPLYLPLRREPAVHIWELPPALREPMTPIEYILYGMVEHQRALATNGVTGIELAGPRYPSLSGLVEFQPSRPVHTVARVIGDLLSKITYRTFVDKLGAFLVMYPVYQWLIMRSYETYKNIPSWSIPVLSQRTTLHPIWISALGVPSLKDAVIANQERYTTEEFQYTFIASINCNWPYGIEAALSYKDGDVIPSKEFWDHTSDLSNWTLDEPFQSRYPELRGVAAFTPTDEGNSSRNSSLC